VYVSKPYELLDSPIVPDCFEILVRLFYLSRQLYLLAEAEPKNLRKYNPHRKHLGHNISLVISEGESRKVCLLSKIGNTKTGVVYEAYDYTLKQIICVKMENQTNNQLDNESEILSLLKDCPGVPHYLYRGTYENNQFIATYPVGVSLEEIMRDRKLTITEAIEVGESLVLLLNFIHERGIIHSDITPKNIILYKGSIRLIDFGVSFRKGDEWPGKGTREFLPTNALLSGYYMDELGDIESAYYVVNFLIDRNLPWMNGGTNDMAARYQFRPNEENLSYLQDVFPEFTNKFHRHEKTDTTYFDCNEDFNTKYVQ
jgi:serine/threonine protein kinase